MAKKITWSSSFAPSYTPKEMLELGIFEGKYLNSVKGVPKDWFIKGKVLAKEEEPDESINRYKIKSRQPLSTWKQNNWIRTDKSGWFEWYCHYFLGRRLGEEDDWQIGRWRSFVARHQAQVSKNCRSKDCRPKQRQGLLQWAWDSDTSFTEEQQEKNLKRISRLANVEVAKVSLESYNLAIEVIIENDYKPLEDHSHKGWYQIPDVTGYLANKEGYLLRVSDKKISKGHFDGRYFKVPFNDPLNIKPKEYVHRLIALAFYGPVDEVIYGKVIVDHIDGDKSNNHYLNLRYATVSENLIYSYQLGTKKPTRKW